MQLTTFTFSLVVRGLFLVKRPFAFLRPDNCQLEFRQRLQSFPARAKLGHSARPAWPNAQKPSFPKALAWCATEFLAVPIGTVVFTNEV
jgi:hypothetical protein